MKAESEAAFQRAVMNLATLYGWACYHAPDNRPIKTTSGRVRKQAVVAGYPDLTLVRDGELIFAELKAEKGRVRPEQTRWLEKLDQVPGVETYVWRPSDFDALHARLAQGRHRVERAA
jgi:hypothetical protein